MKTRLKSGGSFLYYRDGVPSQVFALSFKKPLNHSALYNALRTALPRYPYLKACLRKRGKEFILVTNDNNPIPSYRSSLKPLCAPSTQNNVMDINFKGKHLWFSMHHAVCDGKGFLPFIKTFLYCYYKEVWRDKDLYIPDLRLPDSPLLDGEMDEPIEKGNFHFDPEKVLNIDRSGMTIPEYLSDNDSYDTRYRFEIKMPAGQVLDACKKLDATPVILFSLMAQKAIRSFNPEVEKPVTANVICDLREAIETPMTFRNCVASVYLPYTRTEEKEDDAVVCKKYRDLLNSQRSVDNLRAIAEGTLKKLSDILEEKSLEEKQALSQMIFAAAPNTFVMSYLGRLELGDVEEELENFQIYTSSTNDMAFEIVSYGSCFCIGIQQSFKDDKYIKAFLDFCRDAGIHAVYCSNRIEYSTPRDRSGKTFGALLKSLVKKLK
ncbi:MAG: hypothetical protein ACI358_06060 [Candidatus Limimorpha sp.]